VHQVVLTRDRRGLALGKAYPNAPPFPWERCSWSIEEVFAATDRRVMEIGGFENKIRHLFVVTQERMRMFITVEK
jgi:hypothetical protein